MPGAAQPASWSCGHNADEVRQGAYASPSKGGSLDQFLGVGIALEFPDIVELRCFTKTELVRWMTVMHPDRPSRIPDRRAR